MSKCFLMYDSRSGSTLLSALLNRYQMVSVSHETGFIPIVLEFGKNVGSVADLDRLISRIEKEVQYAELGIDHDEVVARLHDLTLPVSERDIIDTILGVYFSSRDPHARIHVVKSPRMLFHALTLLDMYPDATIVHIIRDGRGVFNSKRTMVSVSGIRTQSNLIKSAVEWKRRIDFSESIGDRLLEVGYEELLSDPDNVLESILDFLSVDQRGREQTKLQSDYSEKIGGRQKHLHENVSREPDASRADRWRSTLSDPEIRLYEYMTREHLLRRGYELVHPESGRFTLMRPAVLGCAVYYIFQQAGLYAQNLWWYVFVDRSIVQKIRSKIFEFKIRV